MSFWGAYNLFVAKAVTVVVLILLLVVGLMALLRGRQQPQSRIQVHKLNDRYRELRQAVERGLTPKTRWSRWRRRTRGEDRAPESSTQRRRVFVLSFDGDLKASQVESLREEVTAVLTVARDGDEVFLRLKSLGGMVPGYGLAASQLARIKERGLTFTVAVDQVAASGGYMMACVADRIIAAPFAIVGSIGVVAELPNFHRYLKDHNIDFDVYTAGQWKRTVTVFGENTAEGQAKLRQQLEDTHQLFKDFVARHRPQADLERVATGEYWHGSQALDLNLVDELQTSDDWLLAQAEQADLLALSCPRRRSWSERLSPLSGQLSRLLGWRSGFDGQ